MSKRRRKKLKHWTEGREHLILRRGELDDHPEFLPWKDEATGESFLVRVRHGLVQPQSQVKPWKWLEDGEYMEPAYDEQQVELVRWAIWAKYEMGWNAAEIYGVLRRFWIYLPGQPPFVSRTIASWIATHAAMAAKGKEWP